MADKKYFSDDMALMLLDASDQFVGLLDPEGRLLYANRTALSFINGDLSSFEGMFFWDTPWWNFDNALMVELQGVIARAKATMAPQDMQVVHRSAEGLAHYFYFTLKPFLDNKHQLLGYIAEGKDINDLVEAQETVRKEIQRYRDLFSNSSDAHLIIEGSLFIEANDKAVDALGYASEAELIKCHPSKFSPEYQPDGRLSTEKADEMISTAYKNGSHRFEWVHIRKDGSPIDVEVVLTPIRSGSKNLLFVTWRDISERIQAQRALIEKQQMLTHLMVGISHELATPIGNAILATSYLKDYLLKGHQTSEDGDKASDTITEEVDALLLLERNLNTTVALLEYFKNYALGVNTEDPAHKPLHNLTKNALEHK